GVSGSTAIGSRCVLAGQTGVVGHIVIGDGVIVGARGVVTKNIPAGSFVSGFPAAPHEKTMKIQALTLRLPEWKDKLSDLETRLDRLEKAGRDRTSGT
ncbi:MAG: UDP-3-O-(3-hydroxymyristoyl)glucosamine N-acyltransferase, partial [Kiritimatiellia bacterium]|nr:UDP-3-O-(3-hydroxymyristoyl)glucosamine N-acyltransferase [Kiritimatiellia bacterium]